MKKRRSHWRGILLPVLICILAAVYAGVIHQKDIALPEPACSDAAESTGIADTDPGSIPDYSGVDVIELNGGRPCFTERDLQRITGEHYSELDAYGRCGPAAAMLDRSMMPSESRGSIGRVRPTGWRQRKYPGLVDSEPPYLYNRCHLIAYAMTGQNANPLNLITGTRYMNAVTMLPYEEAVLRYLDDSGNHVLYRVTPDFRGSELVARGLELEACSVEDHGAGICFHVYLYNIQPGVEIDYLTGESRLAD